MALKVKDDEDKESSNDEQTKFKAFITRQFKKISSIEIVKEALSFKPPIKVTKQSRTPSFKD